MGSAMLASAAPPSARGSRFFLWRHAIERKARTPSATSSEDVCGALARVQRGERQRCEGDELALRHEDHARDGKDQQQGDGDQRVDRAVDDRILNQKENYRGIHATPLLPCSGVIAPTGPPAGAICCRALAGVNRL